MLKDHLANFDPRIVGLRPTLEELPIVAKAFHVYYDRVPGQAGDYTMDHTALVYLMDRKGEFFGTIGLKEDPATVVEELIDFWLFSRI